MPRYNEKMRLIVALQNLAKKAQLPRFSYTQLWDLPLVQLRRGKERMEQLAAEQE